MTVWCNCVSIMIAAHSTISIGSCVGKSLLLFEKLCVVFRLVEIIRVVSLNDQLWKGKSRWAVQNPPPLYGNLPVDQRGLVIQ